MFSEQVSATLDKVQKKTEEYFAGIRRTVFSFDEVQLFVRLACNPIPRPLRNKGCMLELLYGRLHNECVGQVRPWLQSSKNGTYLVSPLAVRFTTT